eukprot:1159994-Pelagomonas_calceolata.AAC.5
MHTCTACKQQMLQQQNMSSWRVREPGLQRKSKSRVEVSRNMSSPRIIEPGLPVADEEGCDGEGDEDGQLP